MYWHVVFCRRDLRFRCCVIFCHTHNQTLSIYFMLSKQLVTLSFSGGGHQIFSKLLSYFTSVVNSELNNIVINFLHAQFYLTNIRIFQRTQQRMQFFVFHTAIMLFSSMVDIDNALIQIHSRWHFQTVGFQTLIWPASLFKTSLLFWLCGKNRECFCIVVGLLSVIKHNRIKL